MPSPKKYNLKDRILSNLRNSKNPLSVKDLQEKLEGEFNKTSIYRQLESLFENQQVHKIETGKATLFEIADHHHAHFQCVKCDLVDCLELPKEFDLDSQSFAGVKVLDMSIDLKGYCQNCQTV